MDTKEQIRDGLGNIAVIVWLLILLYLLALTGQSQCKSNSLLNLE